MTFHLPKNITAQRKPISSTSYEYVLRHSELGQLGKIKLNATPQRCSLTYEIHGEAHQKITEMRRVVFEPLLESIQQSIAEKCEPGFSILVLEDRRAPR